MCKRFIKPVWVCGRWIGRLSGSLLGLKSPTCKSPVWELSILSTTNRPGMKVTDQELMLPVAEKNMQSQSIGPQRCFAYVAISLIRPRSTQHWLIRDCVSAFYRNILYVCRQS